MKTIQLDSFKGVRNDVSPERFDPKDLQKAVNIELDETGKPFRRLGTTALDAVATHSLWANDELAYCVRGSTLHQIHPDMTMTDLAIPILGTRVAYQRVANDVFFTDGLITGIASLTGYRPWGIVPPPSPVVTKGLGSLRAGKYLVCVTYVRTSGLESGSSYIQAVDVDGTQSIDLALTASTDPLASSINVYVTDVNGEVPYLVATLSNSDASTSISALPATRTVPVRTSLMGPMPAGQLIGYYKGRLYVAENNYLWYTQPYEYELTRRAMNFIGFTSPIKTFAPVSDGIFVGSEDDTVFLAGDEPDTFQRVQVAPYGTVLGTEVEVPGYYVGASDERAGNPKMVPMWMSTHGLCAGMDGGVFTNLTGGRYVIPEGVAKGASLLKVRGASPQLVTTLFS